jgi:uncharacterized protein YeeX (DUF496 family)
MFTNRQISENFEVQINTLYNWRKTKPKLYRYLQNADANLNDYREVNALLDEYAKGIKGNFSVEEIEYFIDKLPKVVSIEDVKNMGKIFLSREYLKIPKEKDILFSIYDKITSLNLIEKYIFYKKAFKYNEKEEKPQIETFFKEFIDG